MYGIQREADFYLYSFMNENSISRSISDLRAASKYERKCSSQLFPGYIIASLKGLYKTKRFFNLRNVFNITIDFGFSLMRNTPIILFFTSIISYGDTLKKYWRIYKECDCKRRGRRFNYHSVG